MAKSSVEKKPVPSKPVVNKEIIDSSAFAFGKENYVLLVISIVVLIIGYMLMSGGKPTDPNVFNEEVFSFRRITLAPIVVLIGYAVGIYAIVKKAD